MTVDRPQVTQSKARHHDVQRAWLASVLATAQLRGFYGTLTLKLEGGIIKRVEKMETLIPPTTDVVSLPPA